MRLVDGWARKVAKSSHPKRVDVTAVCFVVAGVALHNCVLRLWDG